MPDNLFSLITFVLITTFTPGPNNISSAAMGVLHGYQKTLPYLAGMNSGLFGVMLMSAWASATLLEFFPMLEPILHYVGAAYILYLAFGMFKASYIFAPSPGVQGDDFAPSPGAQGDDFAPLPGVQGDDFAPSLGAQGDDFAPSLGVQGDGFEEENVALLGFTNGLLLQVLNPKLIVYSLTLFSTFLAPITHRLGLLLLAVVLLTLTSFTATSTWALFGMLIKRYLNRPKARMVVNLVLALFLVYTALELAQVF